MRTIVFVLSVIILVLLLVLFVRDRGDKEVEQKLFDLTKTNFELQNAKEEANKVSIAQRLGTAGIDTLNLWKFEIEECKIPYCLATRIGVEGVEDFVGQTRGLSRWKGYVTEYKEAGEVGEAGEAEEATNKTCEAFVIEGGANVPINTDLLADVEKKLLKAANEKNQIEITVYSTVTEGEPISCDTPAYVLNVHL